MFRSALDLNRKGVMHFKAQEIENARASFVSALDIMKNMSGKYIDDESFELIDFFWSDRCLKEPDGDTSSCFIFSRALMCLQRSKEQQKSQLTKRERDLLAFEATISILYNIALSLHLGATEKNCASLLRKSLKGYKFTLGKIRKQSQHYSTEDYVKKTFFLSLGILNNIGQIYLEFGSSSEAQRYFQQLGDLIEETNLKLDGATDIEILTKMWKALEITPQQRQSAPQQQNCENGAPADFTSVFPQN